MSRQTRPSDGLSYVAHIEEKYGCALEPATQEKLSDALEDKRQLDEQVSAIRALSASIANNLGLDRSGPKSSEENDD